MDFQAQSGAGVEQGRAAFSRFGRGCVRKVLRCSRPVVLTIAAALAFAALLRFHHEKFEDDMVRSFQRQQLDATRSLAVSVEESVANIRRGLESLASHPDVCRLAPSMQNVLLPYLQREQATLDDLAVVDTHNAVLWKSRISDARCRTPQGRNSEEKRSDGLTVWGLANSRSPASTFLDTRASFRVTAPIMMDGREVASLRATVSMYRVALNSRLKIANSYGGVCWMLSDTGEMVYSNAMPRERNVVYSLRTADAVKEPVHNADLLPYVAEQLFGKSTSGNSGLGVQAGLVEVARPGDPVDELAAYAPIHLEGRRMSDAIKDSPGEGRSASAAGGSGLRYGVLLAAPKAEVSVPIVSHERVTYALIAALALLYFATGYAAYRSERAHTQLAEQRRMAAEQSNVESGSGIGDPGCGKEQQRGSLPFPPEPPNPPPETPSPSPRTPTGGPSVEANPELCWDRSEATRLAGGNAGTVALIVKMFLAELRKVLPRAEHAALARDASTLAAIAHQWKGSLGLLGARRAQSCAARLEEVCRLGEPERLSESFSALRRELVELERDLSAQKENDLCKSS